MKRKIMFVLASLLIGCSVCFAAPEVKTKKIKYASNAYYEGEVLKKDPHGKGKVIINEDYKNRIEITGLFDDTEVTEGEVAFVMPGVTYKGSLSVKKKIEIFAPEISEFCCSQRENLLVSGTLHYISGIKIIKQSKIYEALFKLH